MIACVSLLFTVGLLILALQWGANNYDRLLRLSYWIEQHQEEWKQEAESNLLGWVKLNWKEFSLIRAKWRELGE